MKIFLNGKEEFLNQPQTIEELRLAKRWEPARIVVELNLEIIAKEEWTLIVLKENDQLEVLSFVGGGSGRIHD